LTWEGAPKWQDQPEKRARTSENDLRWYLKTVKSDRNSAGDDKSEINLRVFTGMWIDRDMD
jgi:hypothetical protein